MQYPNTSKSCRRLSKYAHSIGVSGVVRKVWTDSGTPNDGAKSEFVLQDSPDSRALGDSREVARMRLRAIVEAR
jgi:hypothetical protein